MAAVKRPAMAIMKHTLCGVFFINYNYKHNKNLWKIIHYPINSGTECYV